VLGGVRGYFIDNPLPGTEYAALHERGSRNVRLASAAPPPRMIATAMRQDDDARDAVERAPQRHPPVELATADDLQQYHVVQRGERLIDIANQYGVSVMRLREANDLQGNQVRPGQQLRIPARSGAG
jgi:nucleoid-associated protein YgaU